MDCLHEAGEGMMVRKAMVVDDELGHNNRAKDAAAENINNEGGKGREVKQNNLWSLCYPSACVMRSCTTKPDETDGPSQMF